MNKLLTLTTAALFALSAGVALADTTTVSAAATTTPAGESAPAKKVVKPVHHVKAHQVKKATAKKAPAKKVHKLKKATDATKPTA